MFCVLLVNLWWRRQYLQKIFLFIVKWFFLIQRKNYVFRASDRKSERGSLSYSKLPVNKLIISIWSNFLENINSIEQLLSKIQRVECKCELGFDAHFHRMPLLLSFSIFLRFYSSARLHSLLVTKPVKSRQNITYTYK